MDYRLYHPGKRKKKKDIIQTSIKYASFAIFARNNHIWWRRQWHPTPVLLPGKSHRRRSLVGCSPWGREELDTTERLHSHFSLSCTGEGNGNPLQCSCLENPRDGGAWWAAVYGVTQSRTRLKPLSSGSSNHIWKWEAGFTCELLITANLNAIPKSLLSSLKFGIKEDHRK